MDAGDYGSGGTERVSGSAPRGARLDRALARTSDAPLREGNRLELLKNGPSTYDDWLAAIARARRSFRGEIEERFGGHLSEEEIRAVQRAMRKVIRASGEEPLSAGTND